MVAGGRTFRIGGKANANASGSSSCVCVRIGSSRSIPRLVVVVDGTGQIRTVIVIWSVMVAGGRTFRIGGKANANASGSSSCVVVVVIVRIGGSSRRLTTRIGGKAGESKAVGCVCHCRCQE